MIQLYKLISIFRVSVKVLSKTIYLVYGGDVNGDGNDGDDGDDDDDDGDSSMESYYLVSIRLPLIFFFTRQGVYTINKRINR